MEKHKYEEIKYKCSKCGTKDLFRNMYEIYTKFDNGSTKTTYLCKKCWKEKKKKGGIE